MNDNAASLDIMNERVDGWVEDVESNQMQSERKARFWPQVAAERMKPL